MPKKFYYGGQAVIEGVMMRGKKAAVTCVRQPDGQICTDEKPLSPLYTGKLRRIPIVRGPIALVESLVLGIQSLMFSTNVALGEEEKMPTGVLWLMVGVAFALAAGLFFMVPLFITRLVSNFLETGFLFSLVEGVIRTVIFIVYLYLVRLMPDIRRVFRYHGAEHKAVNAMEHGAPLEVAAVRPYSTAHVRCGTGFLFTVMIISVFVFSLVGKPDLFWMILSRILLIPVIAALAYEFVFFGARHVNNPFMRLLLAPGLWLQKLTTGEPDDSQIEVACIALKRAAELDQPAETSAETPAEIPATSAGTPA